MGACVAELGRLLHGPAAAGLGIGAMGVAMNAVNSAAAWQLFTSSPPAIAAYLGSVVVLTAVLLSAVRTLRTAHLRGRQPTDA